MSLIILTGITLQYYMRKMYAVLCVKCNVYCKELNRAVSSANVKLQLCINEIILEQEDKVQICDRFGMIKQTHFAPLTE